MKHNFSRARWYFADYPASSVDDNEMLSWCLAQFGKPGSDAWSRWFLWAYSIRFRDEADYMLFTLRWL